MDLDTLLSMARVQHKPCASSCATADPEAVESDDAMSDDSDESYHAYADFLAMDDDRARGRPITNHGPTAVKARRNQRKRDIASKIFERYMYCVIAFTILNVNLTVQSGSLRKVLHRFFKVAAGPKVFPHTWQTYQGQLKRSYPAHNIRCQTFVRFNR